MSALARPLFAAFFHTVLFFLIRPAGDSTLSLSLLTASDDKDTEEKYSCAGYFSLSISLTLDGSQTPAAFIFSLPFVPRHFSLFVCVCSENGKFKCCCFIFSFLSLQFLLQRKREERLFVTSVRNYFSFFCKAKLNQQCLVHKIRFSPHLLPYARDVRQHVA